MIHENNFQINLLQQVLITHGSANRNGSNSPIVGSGNATIDNLTEEVKNISPKIQIFTGDGKEVLSQKINEAKNTFDVSNFAKGIYYISLSDETKLISTKKIIIN